MKLFVGVVIGSLAIFIGAVIGTVLRNLNEMSNALNVLAGIQ